MKKSDMDLENWSLLLKSYNKILRKIKQDLKAQGLGSLETYDVLWTLEREPGRKLRLLDLGEKVDLEKYNVTRLVDKLVEDKLVVKVLCEEDKRGTYALITEKGLRYRQSMWAVYKGSIKEHFGAMVNEEDTSRLSGILKTIYGRLT